MNWFDIKRPHSMLWSCKVNLTLTALNSFSFSIQLYYGTIIVKYMIPLPSNKISYLHKQTCEAIFLHQRYILHKR